MTDSISLLHESPRGSCIVTRKQVIFCSVFLLLNAIATLAFLGIITHAELALVENTDYLVNGSPSGPANPDDGKDREQEIEKCLTELRQSATSTYSKRGEWQGSCNVLVDDGLIVSTTAKSNEEADETIELNGRFVTPGLIDMHSHVGLHQWPSASANNDVNEKTDPVSAQVRAIDAFNPRDTAIALIRSGGVTTSQVMPGSSNVIGGQTMYVKMRRSSTISGMMIDQAKTGLKMACGENPKRVYGSKQTPGSRMGNIWVLREKLEEARALMAEQERYCALNDVRRVQTKRPFSIALQPLVDLLTHQAILNVHCYTVPDFEAMMRVSDEFDFRIDTFHHAHEAYLIAKELARRHINVALFADSFHFKMESYYGSVHAPVILSENNVSVAMKTDHPVLYSRELIYEAQKAHHYGLSERAALQSVTTVPAAAISLSHRIGALEPGYDADIVVWDRHPLRWGAKPDVVLIDGEVSVRRSEPPRADAHVAPSGTRAQLEEACGRDGSEQSDAFQVWNVNIYDGTPNATSSAAVVHGCVTVKDGLVSAIDSMEQCSELDGYKQIRVLGDGAVLVPAFIDGGTTSLGLVEVSGESVTKDGAAYSSKSDEVARVHAVDGARSGSILLDNAFAAGVHYTLALPTPTSALVAGIGGLLRTKATPNTLIAEDNLCLVVEIGGDVKKSASMSASISGQISTIRELLEGGRLEAHNRSNVWAQVHNGELPLLLKVHQADEIASILQLKQESPAMNLIVHGGAEAHVLASELAAADVGVILSPPRCRPDAFDVLRCADDAFARLHEAGVRVAMSVSGRGDRVRNARFEAGWLRNDEAFSGRLSTSVMLSAIGSTLADMLALPSHYARVRVGDVAAFTVFDSDALAVASRPLLHVTSDTYSCNLRQF